MAHDGQHSLLSDAQKNSLTVTLRLLEERILFYKMLLNKQLLPGLLTRYEIDRPAELLSRLENNFDQILDLVKRAKEKFDLTGKTTTLTSSLNAYTSYFWSLLIDLKSDKLVRYGDVKPGLKQELDPLIDQLIEQLQMIDRCQK